ncbi:MAG: hypothetical protein LBR46_00970 [Prevotella sp.]|nr:hypothetical protein [Prevotella sp.]
MYVWNGTEWVHLGQSAAEDLAPGVYEFTDKRDGEKYLCGNFGTAGDWMLENLRYIPPQSDVDYPNYSHNAVNNDNASTAKYYAYPGPNGTYDAASAEYNWEHRLWKVGIYYNWFAAVNYGTDYNDPGDVDQGAGKPGSTTQVQVRGVCPAGWHLPSHSEWVKLIDIMYNDPTKYSTALSGNPGQAMKSPCHLPDAGPTYGLSFSSSANGFSGLLSGVIKRNGTRSYYGESVSFWSSSKQDNWNTYYMQLDDQRTEENSDAGSRVNYSAVRCKKDETSPAPAPAVPTGTNDFFFCLPSGTPNLSVSVGTGETVDWYDAATGGTKLSEVTPYIPASPITAKTIYYAEARNTTTGAVSATRTAVTAAPYDDLSLIKTTETSANSDRTDWLTAWGDEVVLHEAKTDVYDSFISAKFGTAGRWMTTNLSAKDYDSNVKSIAIRQLDGPRISSNGKYDEAYWCYANGKDVTKVDAHPFAGLLYTWDAATASKGQSNGLFWSGSEGNQDHGPRQGVCPDGWHLPSDMEWRDLENEIIRYTAKYSTTSNIGDAGVLDGDQEDSPRESVVPMLSMCRMDPTYPTVGSSFRLQNGGFNVMMAGFVVAGSTKDGDYHYVGQYWTSSFGKASADRSAWSHQFYWDAFHIPSSLFTVRRVADLRNNMRSVRCKKDE